MIITTITSLGLALGQIIDSRQREGERTVAKWVCLAPGEVFLVKAFHECPLSDLVNLQKRQSVPAGLYFVKITLPAMGCPRLYLVCFQVGNCCHFHNFHHDMTKVITWQQEHPCSPREIQALGCSRSDPRLSPPWNQTNFLTQRQMTNVEKYSSTLCLDLTLSRELCYTTLEMVNWSYM